MAKVDEVAVDEVVLERALTELAQSRSWTPRLLAKLAQFVRTADDWALYRVNPLAWASEQGAADDEAVDLFLGATKAGIFELHWSLVCPLCGDAVQRFSSLRSVCGGFTCALCQAETETRLDEYVHVSFVVAPALRPIAAHFPERLTSDEFCFRYRYIPEALSGGPGTRPFRDIVAGITRATAWLEPGQSLTFTPTLGPGGLAVYDMTGQGVAWLQVSTSEADNPPLELVLDAQGFAPPTATLAVGALALTVRNAGPRRAALMLPMMPQAALDATLACVAAGRPPVKHFAPFLNGRRLLTSQSFRTLFGGETIAAAEGLGVRDIAILFTDLKGSTALYDEIGDLQAFALVHRHFERVGRAIEQARGAVVKTIGDAVMATFEEPASAVQAACDMLREIEAFNRELGSPAIALKVGVHRGASIAVTLNDNLDFFGQTVNIAARVQGLADADEIYLTDEVWRAPGVQALLADRTVTPRSAQLKGVARPVQVYRVT
jgi:class 3 adenylate cyclase